MVLVKRTPMRQGRIIEVEARLSRITRGPRHLNFFLLVTILVGSGAGQLRNMAVDETQVLKEAKKVAVFINLGPPAAAPYRPDFARAKKQISEKLAKQKLQLVADPSKADIILVATEFNENHGATASATTNGQATTAGANDSTYSQTTTAVVNDMICLGDEIKIFKGGKVPSEGDAPIWSTSEVCGFSWPLNRAMDKLAKAMKK